jgi:hypothetical protein
MMNPSAEKNVAKGGTWRIECRERVLALLGLGAAVMFVASIAWRLLA